MNLDLLTRFYGLDWIGMSLSIASMWLVGNRRRSGFVCMMVSNVCWVGVGGLAGSAAIMLGNAVFLVTSARGWLRWREREADQAT